jgi:hypothetical protein
MGSDFPVFCFYPASAIIGRAMTLQDLLYQLLIEVLGGLGIEALLQRVRKRLSVRRGRRSRNYLRLTRSRLQAQARRRLFHKITTGKRR